ncbi:MAG: T9SS type A sorting domain-containing protein [Flavobacteriales bacterium]|nr:T9SS type A sorting domain-containing protein [Flavobacteriales bacterium]
MAVVSYDHSGSQYWINTNPGSLNNVTESCLDVINDIYGNIFTIGYNAVGNWEVMKYNDQGIYQWTYIFWDYYFGYEVFIDHMFADGNGNLFFAATGNGDIQVVKLLPDGSLGWHTSWVGPSGFSDEVFELTHDLQGNLCIAGRAGFANSWYDMLLIKIDPNGNIIWDVNYEGLAAQNDEAKGLVVSPNGSVIYIVGYSRGATANADLTVVKYAQTVGITEEGSVNLVTYPNPVLEKLNVQNCPSNQLLRIYDVTGTEEWNGFLSAQKTIDISYLVSGFYSLSA